MRREISFLIFIYILLFSQISFAENLSTLELPPHLKNATNTTSLEYQKQLADFLQYTAINRSTATTSAPNGISDIEEKVDINISKERPRVGDNVNITIKLFGTPLKDTAFTWYLNNKEIKKGIGANTFDFVVNKGTKVKLELITGTGNKIIKNFDFNPQNNIIIWESDTYIPPFYKGKPLHTQESILKLHGLNLDVKNPLTNFYEDYTWKQDGQVQGNNSGVGKNTFTYKPDILGREPLFEMITKNILTLKDRLSNDSKKKESKVFETSTKEKVRIRNTKILTYEKHPTLGVLFNKNLENIKIKEKEKTIIAYPTYFSANYPFELDYNWYGNGYDITNNKNFITFTRKATGTESKMSLTVKNKKSLLQYSDISYIIDTNEK